MNSKAVILQHLHSLISENVLGDKQYSSRYKGFVGELAFIEWLENKPIKRKTYSGGYFLPLEKGNASLQNPIYFTVSRSEPTEHLPIYKAISKIGCSHMFFIQWMDTTSIESWNAVDKMGLNLPLPVPPMITYSFDCNANSFQVGNLSDMIDLYKGKARKSNSYKIPLNIKNEFIKKLTTFESNHLLDLYVQRLIFDGFIGFGKIHGIPSDIDLIIDAKVKNELIFLEVKEKDLSKGSPKGFGMDVPRIQAIVQLSSTTQIPVFYIVRQVNNQSDRLFLNWRYINMHDFKSYLNETLIEGGSGMGYENGSYPTQICPEKYFGTMGDIS